MSDARRYEPIGPRGELDAECGILAAAFGIEPDGAMRWIESSGRDLFRRVVEGDRTVAVIVLIPMGIYFGGRSVPMMGIAGVAVDPAARGSGVARWMLARALEETRASGFALSTLYSAMHPLYRSVGFEHAGSQFTLTLPLHQLPKAARRFEPYRPEDFEQVRECYNAYAHQLDGYLDRGPYIWRRVWDVRGRPIRGFVSRGSGGEVDAYVFCDQQSTGDHYADQVVKITDMAARTPEGLRGIMGFLRGYSSIAGSCTWRGGPTHPILTALDDRRYTATNMEHWMLRVVDPAAALAARGVRGEPPEPPLPVTLEDRVFPDQSGPWTITRTPEGLEARRGGPGGPRLTDRALAALYTGFMPARHLALIGLLDADDHALNALDRLFPTTGPTMADMF